MGELKKLNLCLHDLFKKKKKKIRLPQNQHPVVLSVPSVQKNDLSVYNQLAYDLREKCLVIN